MPTDVAVRLVQDDDFPAIADLTSRFIRTSAIHFASEPVSARELDSQWRAGQERHPWLVATVAGAFAGYAKAGMWRERAAYNWTVETGIYLEDAHRGVGVGRRLYRRLLELLTAQGYRSVVAGATLPNEASTALHESLGFVPVGTVSDAGFKMGRWHDVGFWQLRLRRDPEEHPGKILAPELAWRTLSAE